MTNAGYDARPTVFGGRYELFQDLGGNASVSGYVARDLQSGQQVILKLLTPEFGSFVGQERFLQGARAASQLENDRILPISDAGNAEGFLYVASPLHNGVSLRDYLNKKRKLPVREATRILRDVIDALAYAHDRGVGHGALSAERIFIVGSRAIVSDFCLGPWIRGRANGASESGRRDELIQADVTALGAIAYELMSGRMGVDRRSATDQAKPQEPPTTAERTPAAAAPQPTQASTETVREGPGPLTPSNIRISNPHGVLMPGTRPAVPPPGTTRRLILRVLLYAIVALIPVAMALWAFLKLG